MNDSDVVESPPKKKLKQSVLKLPVAIVEPVAEPVVQKIEKSIENDHTKNGDNEKVFMRLEFSDFLQIFVFIFFLKNLKKKFVFFGYF